MSCPGHRVLWAEHPVTGASRPPAPCARGSRHIGAPRLVYPGRPGKGSRHSQLCRPCGLRSNASTPPQCPDKKGKQTGMAGL